MKNLLFMLLAGLSLACCKVQTPQDPVEAFPKKASPGDLVVLRNLAPAVTGKSTEVLFDKTGAPIIGNLDSTGLRVMVPNLNPGKVQVHILEGGREINTTDMEILPSTATQLVLEMNADGKISTLTKKPYSGGFDEGFAQASRQLSYDIMNAQGQVLFSASVAYPATERMEVFDDPSGNRIRRTDEKKQVAVFPLKIPNLEGATSIRLYDSGAEDLTKSAGRAKRKLIQEISIR